MAGANTRAMYTISAAYQYKASSGSANAPASVGPQAVPLAVTGSTGASKGYDGGGAITIPAGTSYTLDLESFTDGINLPASWTALVFLAVEHNASSLATSGIDLTGAAANAVPSLRGSKLLPGEGCVPFYNRTTSGSGTAGQTITGPNSRIVITNLDAANDATVNILLMGN